MQKYRLKMNPIKCAFGVSADHFLGFIVHEEGIEIDPKRVEAIKKIPGPTCKKEVQSLLGKVNYLRRFISNLTGWIESLLPLVRLKHEAYFRWGGEQQKAFDQIKVYMTGPPMLRAPESGRPFRLYITAQDKIISTVLT
jgi:hypothetical protein